ncbi:hypothetical protein [Aquabacterium humicola]|uniref:hypothetical protein n=1 Tax=Aquabacterium humicola TaxID=3237377 RepID=UPI002542E93D|nr:hypothetical protein [Rubrivivax pictus]
MTLLLRSWDMLRDGTYTTTLSGKSTVSVRVVLKRGWRLDVYLHVGDDHRPAVTHFVSLGKQRVTVVDIFGNAPGSPWHRAGLSALAVNTAIQFLKVLYPPSTPIRGHIVGARDAQRQEERRAFWRSFGFDITAPDRRSDEHLRGTVESVRLLPGLVFGEHPRILDITTFTQVEESKASP